MYCSAIFQLFCTERTGMDQSDLYRLLEDRSVVHVVIIIKVLPADRVGVIVIIVLFRFMQMIKNPVHDSSNGPGVFTNLIQCLQLFFLCCGFLFWCHFRMITEQQYLSLMPLKHIGRKRYVEVMKKRRALHAGPPHNQCSGGPSVWITVISLARRFNWMS